MSDASGKQCCLNFLKSNTFKKQIAFLPVSKQLLPIHLLKNTGVVLKTFTWSSTRILTGPMSLSRNDLRDPFVPCSVFFYVSSYCERYVQETDITRMSQHHHGFNDDDKYYGNLTADDYTYFCHYKYIACLLRERGS